MQFIHVENITIIQQAIYEIRSMKKKNCPTKCVSWWVTAFISSLGLSITQVHVRQANYKCHQKNLYINSKALQHSICLVVTYLRSL